MSPKESIKNDVVIKLIESGVETLGVRGLARAVGISPAIVTRYIQGKVGEPSQSTLEKIAAYFGVSVAWLRGGSVGPLERLLEGLKIGGINPGVFNKTMAGEIGRDIDFWRVLVSGKVSNDWVEIMCHLFGINDHWVMSGERPTLSAVGGIVGTVTVSHSHMRTISNPFSRHTHTDPHAGGDSHWAEGTVESLMVPPAVNAAIFKKMIEWYQGNNPKLADYIAYCLREDEELRKMVDRLLADDSPDGKND